MAASQKAVLLTWTDIPEADEDAFNEWYNREHVRDRVRAVPGFISGRRFIATSGSPKYLALYETDSAAVLRSEAYLALITNPDERSRHFIMRFRSPIRTLAHVSVAVGEAEGGMLGVRPLTPATSDPQKVRAVLANDIMPAMLRMPGIVAVRLIERIPPDEALSTARHVRQGDRSLKWALLAEAVDTQALIAAFARLDDALRSAGAEPEMESVTLRQIYRVSA